jgi:hypothetical protein
MNGKFVTGEPFNQMCMNNHKFDQNIPPPVRFTFKF